MLLLLRVGELLGFGVDPACEFVVTTAVHVNVVSIVACIRTALARAVAVAVGIIAIDVLATSLSLLASLAVGLLGRLVLLALLGCSLQDERGELVTEIGVGVVTASLAVELDEAVLDVHDGLGVLAFLAEDELGDEAVEVVLELAGVVGAVDDPAVVSRVGVGLGTQLEAKVLDDIWGRSAYVMGKGCLRRGKEKGRRLTGRRAVKGVGNAGQVDDDGLDAVALAFDLGLEALHLVAVEGVGDIAANVNGSHGCGGGVDVFEIVTGGRTDGSGSDLLYVYRLLETCNSNLQCTEFVLCDSWSSKHNVNRW